MLLILSAAMQINHRDAARSDGSADGRAHHEGGESARTGARELHRLSDPSATDDERQRRKRRLLKGPKEFRDIRGKR